MRKRRLSANAPSIEALLRSKATPPDRYLWQTFAVCLLREREPNPAHLRAKTHAGKGKEKKDSESNNCANAGNTRAKSDHAAHGARPLHGADPHAAWAEETGEGSEQADTFSVVLTVVDTTDAEKGVLANVKVDGMTADDTVADLLAKAGFSKAADAAATEGNDKAYAESYGSPVLRGNKTSQGADGKSTLWATMYNGDSSAYASAQLKSKLQARGHYQYIYGSASTFAYTIVIPNLVSAAVTDPLAGSTVNPVPAPAPKPEPAPEPAASTSMMLQRLRPSSQTFLPASRSTAKITLSTTTRSTRLSH